MTIHQKIKNQVIAELEVTSPRFSTGKIYNFVLNELFKGDVEAADQFMLSNEGGYTPEELRTIKSKTSSDKRRYQASNQVRAF